MCLYRKTNGNTCGEYTKEVLLSKQTNSECCKFNAIIIIIIIERIWLIFFQISVGNTSDTFFNQTNTHLNKLCEVDEPVDEEPNKSIYAIYFNIFFCSP